jgi:hypothetical protein
VSSTERLLAIADRCQRAAILVATCAGNRYGQPLDPVRLLRLDEAANALKLEAERFVVAEAPDVAVEAEADEANDAEESGT